MQITRSFTATGTGSAEWFTGQGHGAAPHRFMTHVAMLEVDQNGSSVTWGEHVTDEEYRATSSGWED
jgi:hypothetical protein